MRNSLPLLLLIAGLVGAIAPRAIAAAPATTAAQASAPSIAPAKLAAEIGERIQRVPEFVFIREEAAKMGVKVYLFGGTAAAYSHYVREDLLREAGDKRFPPMRFDYDYTNIFRSTQDLDVVIDGTPEQATELQRRLGQKFPHFIGDKGAGWEVRPLKTNLADKEAILDNPNFLNQHTDSHSTGTVELTKTDRGVSPVRDVRDWSSREPQFLRDVAEARLHYYFNPLHYKTSRAAAGLNPPILSVIRYLTKAFQYGLEIRKEDLPQIRKIVAEFDPKSLQNDYLQRWVEKNGKKLFQHAVDLEYAWNTLEEVGLRRKLALVKNNPTEVDSMAWWMNKQPLRTKPVGEGKGPTAAAIARQKGLPELTVAHETNSYLAYESITRQRGGELNALISREGTAGESAAFGEGFYSRIGRAGARGTGFTIRMTVDPRAREGTDFTLAGDYLILHNKAAAKVISEQITISMPEYFRLLAEGQSFSGDDKALVEQFYRRVGKSGALSADDEKAVLEVVRSELKKPVLRKAVLSEWFRFPSATKYPDLVETIIDRDDETLLRLLVKDAFGRPEWAAHPQLVQKTIDRGSSSVHAALFREVFHRPQWAKHPELVAQFFGPNPPKDNRLILPTLGRRGPTLTKSEPEFWYTNYLMPEPAWAQNSDIARIVMRSATDGAQAAFAKALKDSHWAKVPALFEEFIEIADEDALSELAKLFALPHWKDQVELQKKLFTRAQLSSRLKLAATMGPDSPLGIFRAEILEALKQGSAPNLASAVAVLLDPAWWKEKELMTALFAKPDSATLDTIARNMNAAYFEKQPELVEKFINANTSTQQLLVDNLGYAVGETGAGSRPFEIALKTVNLGAADSAAELLRNPEFKNYPQFIQILIDRNARSIDEKLARYTLSGSTWAQRPEFVSQLVERGDKTVLRELVKNTLNQRPWSTRPEILRAIIEIPDPTLQRHVAEYIFSEGYWQERTELLAAFIERADLASAQSLASWRLQIPWEKEKEMYKRALASGTLRARENVAAMILGRQDLEERKALAMALLRESGPEVQKIMRQALERMAMQPSDLGADFVQLLKAPKQHSCVSAFSALSAGP